MSYFNFFEDNNINLNPKKVTYEILVSFKDRKKKHLDTLHYKIKIIDTLLLFLNIISIIFAILSLELSLNWIQIELIDLTYLWNETDISNFISFTSVNNTLNYETASLKMSFLNISNSAIIFANNSFTSFSFIPYFNYNLNFPQILRMVISLFTIINIVLLIVRYKFLINFDKIRLYLKIKDTLFSSNYYIYLLIEIIINFIHPIPYVKYNIQMNQRETNQLIYIDINVFFTLLLMVIRIYRIFIYFSFHSKWYSYGTEKLCLQSQTSLNNIFTLKAEFKERPFMLIGVSLIITIFILGYTIRCIEMHFMIPLTLNWLPITNGIWLIIITMATVGFGDFFPVSILGRSIAIISCFLGTFLISLLVAAMTVAIEFNSQETIAFDSINAAEFEIQYGIQATILIQLAYKYRLLMKEIQKKGLINLRNKAKSELFKNFKQNLENFRRMKKSKNDSLEVMIMELSISKIEENLTVEIEKIKCQLHVIKEIRDLLLKYSDNQNKIEEMNVDIYKDLKEICYYMNDKDE